MDIAPSAYNPFLVLLSFVIAMIGSYTALDLVHHIQNRSKYWLGWLLCGAVAMGTGIWSTHFVGMLALRLPLTVSYNLEITLLSLALAIGGSSIALGVLSLSRLHRLAWVGSGLCLGGSIAGMHYTGMAAVEMTGEMHYNPFLVGVSLGIALVSAFSVLGLMSWAKEPQPNVNKAAIALLMALGITGMHYTGMAATYIHTIPGGQAEPSSPAWLAIAIGVGTLLMLSLALLASLYEQQLLRQTLREQHLQASEERFRLLIQEMQVGVLLTNLQAEVIIANEAALSLLNCCDEHQLRSLQPFGAHCTFVDEKGQWISVEALPVQRSIAQGQPIFNEVLGLVLPEGCCRWLLINVTPQCLLSPGSQTQEIDQIVCTISDITTHKMTELALRQTADRERTIAGIIRQMRQTLNLEEIFGTTTTSVREVLNCDRVLIYRFNTDWSGSLIAESVSQNWTAMVVPPYPEILVSITTNNESCTIQNSIDLENEEDLLQDTYLRENKGGFYRRRSSYRCVPDVEQEGFSECYLKLLRTLEAKAYIIVPIFLNNQLWGLLAAYQNDRPRQWVNEEIKMMVQLAGQLGVAIQQVDLLEQTRQQSLELQEAKEIADRANRAKSEFLANMSHELRTPLNAVLGFTQLMQRDSSLAPQNQDYLNIINRSGEHLLELINDILEMTKIESGRICYHQSTFDLWEFLSDLERMLRVRAEGKGLSFSFERGPIVPQFISTDKGKLRQILINLLGNAIKFTEAGTVTLRVEVGLPSSFTPPDLTSANLSPSNLSYSNLFPSNLSPDLALGETNDRCYLNFSIEDTGVGIAFDELDQLFKPFSQTRSGLQSGEGTGLGLPISRKFIQLMGGDIQVSSVVNQGSTFLFFIPYQPATLELLPTAALSTGSGSQTHSQKQKIKALSIRPKILAVEDNVTNRLLLVEMLTEMGFEVQEAENGKVAIELWQSWHPDLILMDMRMPVMDGYRATQIIKKQPKGENTIVIALTASAFEEQRQQILNIGCDDFVRKPFQAEQLLETIVRYLNLELEPSSDPVPESVPKMTQTSGGEFKVGDHLKQQSLPWLEQLQQAASQGSDDRLFALLDELPEEQEMLKQHLKTLVMDFRFDRILELVP